MVNPRLYIDDLDSFYVYTPAAGLAAGAAAAGSESAENRRIILVMGFAYVLLVCALLPNVEIDKDAIYSFNI